MLVRASFCPFSRQPQFLVALVNVLGDATKSQVARMAAGLQLKNQLTSKDASVRLQYQQRWMALDGEVKSVIREMVRKSRTTNKYFNFSCFIARFTVNAVFLSGPVEVNFESLPVPLFYRRFELSEQRRRDLLLHHR